MQSHGCTIKLVLLGAPCGCALALAVLMLGMSAAAATDRPASYHNANQVCKTPAVRFPTGNKAKKITGKQ